jgi:hypothetical protein
MTDEQTCRTCRHNTYGGSPQITEFVDCGHPITLDKTPKWKPGDPAMVSWRTADMHVRDLWQIMPCPTWETKEEGPDEVAEQVLPKGANP